ncbi:hypothetical protein X948_4252 [Burkholderia pseudomallei MSHR5608]|nr:hypothetical protein X948_4252 [Burkholderia pseudomallei MSHR5608]
MIKRQHFIAQLTGQCRQCHHEPHCEKFPVPINVLVGSHSSTFGRVGRTLETAAQTVTLRVGDVRVSK